MSNRLPIILVLLGVLTTMIFVGASRPALADASVPSMRIVGYFHNDSFNQINNVEYSKLTHVIWEGCACTSNSDPTLKGDWGKLSTLRAKTSASGTKLLASLMGGNWTSFPLATIVANTGLRATLVANLVKLVSDYSLDGIDIDWEGTDISQANYHALLVQLRAALPSGKLISVCGPAGLAYHPATDYQYWFNPATDTPLIDMYEVMLYGIAYPAEATYTDFVTYSQMWINAGFPAYKLNLGICATASDSVQEVTAYRQVVAQLNPATNINQANVSTIPNWSNASVAVQGNVLWWNGYDLAVSKTQWAKGHNVGGMMIWALDDDACGNPKSLLRGVYNTVMGGTTTTATVTLGNLSQAYNGIAKSVTTITNPAGLSVSVTYNGSATAPTNAGSYNVVATITSPNYSGNAAGTLTIAKMAPVFSSLSAPGINYGTTSTSLGGTIKSGTLIPSGNVLITLNGVTQTATINGSGNFSSSFATGSLAASKSPYTISYVYAGDTNFTKISEATNALTVIRQYSVWDVNQDGAVNVLDMILVGQHLGESGSPGWEPEDVNSDGIVNVLDNIMVGQHWTK